MTMSSVEMWVVGRVARLMQERSIPEDESLSLVKAEIEAGLCPYVVEEIKPEDLRSVLERIR